MFSAAMRSLARVRVHTLKIIEIQQWLAWRSLASISAHIK